MQPGKDKVNLNSAEWSLFLAWAYRQNQARYNTAQVSGVLPPCMHFAYLLPIKTSIISRLLSPITELPLLVFYVCLLQK